MNKIMPNSVLIVSVKRRFPRYCVNSRDTYTSLYLLNVDFPVLRQLKRHVHFTLGHKDAPVRAVKIIYVQILPISRRHVRWIRYKIGIPLLVSTLGFVLCNGSIQISVEGAEILARFHYFLFRE